MTVCLHAELALGLCHQPFDLGGAWTPRATGSVNRECQWSAQTQRRDGTGFHLQTYLLGLLLRRGPSFDVDIQVLNERVSLCLPAQDDGRTGALVVGGQADGFEERVALGAGVVEGRFDAQRFLGAFQDVSQKHGLSDQVEDGPTAEEAVDAVGDAVHAAHHIVDVDDARAGSAVRGNLDGLGASALPCREQGAEIGAPDPARAAVHLGRTNNGDVEHVTGSEDGLLVGRPPANCSGGLALGQTRSGGDSV